jgi:hypothetical protein
VDKEPEDHPISTLFAVFTKSLPAVILNQEIVMSLFIFLGSALQQERSSYKRSIDANKEVAIGCAGTGSWMRWRACTKTKEKYQTGVS